MATTQKTRDTASRTNPRSNPMMVEPNRTKSINTSAAVMYSQALRADSQALRHFQALRAEFNGVAATPFDRLCMNRIILPERYACRRETRVTNPKLACRRNQTRRLPGGLELRDRLGSGAAIRHGADAHSVPQRGPRTALRHGNRKALRLQLVRPFIDVSAARAAAQLHRPRTSRHPGLSRRR